MNLFPKINNSGFTLLELLVAMIIFAVGILGASAMQLSSISGNNHGRVVSEASNVAADRIETLLSWDYDHPALIDDDDGKDETDADSDTDSGDGTAQDADNDGIDDNDGNFGLDDLDNPDGHVLTADGHYDIYWNVAVDNPLQATKTIRFYIVGSGNKKPIVMNFVKYDEI